jgi:hypothetical protein
LKQTFDFFAKCGVSDFIFLFDLDFSNHYIRNQKEKLREFKALINDIRPRGIHSHVFHNLIFDKGIAFNKDLPKAYTSRRSPAVFLSIDLNSANNYNELSQDINRLLYTHKVFSFFTHFDSIIEYIDDLDTNDYLNLFSNQGFGFGFDLNYLFDPSKSAILSRLVLSNAMVAPMISGDLSNYISFPRDFEYLVERSGNNDYAALCRKISKCALKLI